MTPFEKIEAQYAAHPKEEPFVNYLLHYHRHGFVFSRPDFFAMGRAVIKEAPHAEILDPRHLFKSEDCNCWYIHAAAGNMSRMWAIQPWPMGWFCWTRLHDEQGELTFAPAEVLKRLCPPDLSTFQNGPA